MRKDDKDAMKCFKVCVHMERKNNEICEEENVFPLEFGIVILEPVFCIWREDELGKKKKETNCNAMACMCLISW